MPIAYPQVLDVQSEARPVAWSERDAIIYALGVGYGVDPVDVADLPFVYEDGLKAVPTFATALASDFVLRDRIGMNFAMVVHGSHKLVWRRPLPPAGSGVVQSRVIEVYDKGPGRGAIIVTETELREDGHPEPLAVATLTRFARGDGGFGGPAKGGEEPHVVPSRAPDASLDVPTLANQALVYRLSGDRNPLHADPLAAAAAGFPRPILHGLSSFGVACRAILRTFAECEPARMKSQQARFSAPVFPGETITLDLWRDGDVVSYQARVSKRDVKIMTNGKAELRPAAAYSQPPLPPP